MSNHKVALVLSGSGHLDGAEITEAVALIIALSQAEFEIEYFAPNRNQKDVVNHVTGETEPLTRNIMVEAARIARGNIQPITQLNVLNYRAIAFAGGFGAVKNLTTFLDDGENSKLISDVATPVYLALKNKIPIIAICAAPLVVAMGAHEIRLENPEITFGHSANAQDFLNITNKWNIKHFETEINQSHTDKNNKLITSGAYMFPNAKPHQILEGAITCVNALNTL